MNSFNRFQIGLQPGNLFSQLALFLVQFFVLFFLQAQSFANRGIRQPHPQQAKQEAEQDKEDDRNALRNRNFKVKGPQVKSCQVIIHKCKYENND